MAYEKFKKGVSKKRISLIYLFYWLMLAYMVAALIFWYISLIDQNHRISLLKLEQIESSEFAEQEGFYAAEQNRILAEEKAKKIQYKGEGSTFLILIIASAILVFRMLRKQLKLSKQQRDFMMAVTHELKTPIAVTKLNLETMLKRQLEPAQQQRLIRSTLSESERLNALSNNMLLLNEMGTAYSIANEDIDLTMLVEECAAEYKTRFSQREIIVKSNGELHAYGDRMLLKLAVNNLLDNAIKYSPKKSAVIINAQMKNGKAVIEIIDEGDGIPTDEAKKIFQKYFRGAERQAKGTGLGLYVTRQIVKQNNGTLEYRPNRPRGSIFTITFA